MQYNIRWLTSSELDKVIKLSANVYNNSSDSYGPNLGPDSNIFKMFLISEDVIGSEYRKVAGVFSSENELIMAIGVRQMHNVPAWLFSWVLSDIKTSKFVIVFKDALKFICNFFESINCNEFYVIHPATRENAYKHIIKFMRERYWTFIEMTIPKFTKCEYSFYWMLMGYQLYHYDVNIRRYILKRE